MLRSPDQNTKCLNILFADLLSIADLFRAQIVTVMCAGGLYRMLSNCALPKPAWNDDVRATVDRKRHQGLLFWGSRLDETIVRKQLSAGLMGIWFGCKMSEKETS